MSFAARSIVTMVRHVFCIFVIWVQATVTEGHNHGKLRLVGGDNSYSGRIELFLNDTWSTVCNVGWGIRDAHVACVMAGFQEAQATYTNAVFGKGSGNILLSNVNCTGEESSLFECAHSGFYVHHCSHEEDVGVVCMYNPKDHTHAGRIVVVVLAIIVVIIISFCLQQHRRLSAQKRRHVTCRETVEFTWIALSSCCFMFTKDESAACTTSTCGKAGCQIRKGGCPLRKAGCQIRKTGCPIRKAAAKCAGKSNSEKEITGKFTYAKFSNEENGGPVPISHNSISSPSSSNTPASSNGELKTEASVHGVNHITSSQNGTLNGDSVVDSAFKIEANLDSINEHEGTIDKAAKVEVSPVRTDQTEKTEAAAANKEATLDKDNDSDGPLDRTTTTNSSVPAEILNDISGLSNSAYEPDYC